MEVGRKFAVRSPEDLVVARQAIKRLAAELGFAMADRRQIEVAALELGTNLLKHAGGGDLEALPIDREGRRGLRLASRDRGPGIPDVALAMTVGFSTAGTLGTGLTALAELMDAVCIESDPAGGTVVTADKWLP